MVALKEILDTWNILEKFHIEDYKVADNSICIFESDFNVMLNASKNKEYIKNLLINSINI